LEPGLAQRVLSGFARKEDDCRQSQEPANGSHLQAGAEHRDSRLRSAEAHRDFRLQGALGPASGGPLRAEDPQRQQPGNPAAPADAPRLRHRVLSLLQEQCRAISVRQKGVKRSRSHEEEAWRPTLAANPSFGGAGQGAPLGRDPPPLRTLGARPGLSSERQVAPHQAPHLAAGHAGGEGLSLGLPLGHGGARPPLGSPATRIRGGAALGRRPAEPVDVQKGSGAALPEGGSFKPSEESPEVSLEAAGGGIKLEVVSLDDEAAAGQRESVAPKWTASTDPLQLLGSRPQDASAGPMVHVPLVAKPEDPMDWQGKDHVRLKSEEQESNTDEVSTGSEHAPGGNSTVLAHSRASSPPDGQQRTQGERRGSPRSPFLRLHPPLLRGCFCWGQGQRGGAGEASVWCTQGGQGG